MRTERASRYEQVSGAVKAESLSRRVASLDSGSGKNSMAGQRRMRYQAVSREL